MESMREKRWEGAEEEVATKGVWEREDDGRMRRRGIYVPSSLLSTTAGKVRSCTVPFKAY
jgi:hypothetical protein